MIPIGYDSRKYDERILFEGARLERLSFEKEIELEYLNFMTHGEKYVRDYLSYIQGGLFSIIDELITYPTKYIAAKRALRDIIKNKGPLEKK
jgi:hypothetical protein